MTLTLHKGLITGLSMPSMANGYEQRMRCPWKELELLLKDVEYLGSGSVASVEGLANAFIRSMAY